MVNISTLIDQFKGKKEEEATPAVNMASAPAPVVVPVAAAAPAPVVEPVVEPVLPPSVQQQTQQQSQKQQSQEITTGTSTEVKQKIESPGMKKENENYAKAIENQQAAIQAKVQAEQEQAKSLANIEIERQNILRDQQTKEDEVRTKFAQEAADRIKKIDADVEDLKKVKFQDYWSDKSAAQEIVGALALGIGAYGAVASGTGQNQAWTILKDSMDRDMAKQQAQVDLRVKAIEQSRLSFDTKEKAQKQELDRLQAYRAASIAQVQSKIDEVKARFPGQVAQANADELKAKLAAEAANNNRTYQTNLAKEVQTKTDKTVVYGSQTTGASSTITDQGKPMSESQLKSQADLNRMNASADILDKLAQEKDFDAKKVGEIATRAALTRNMRNIPVVGGMAGPFVEAIAEAQEEGLTESERQYINEARNFVAGKLRKESGASITDSEFRIEYDRYFPSPGDTPKTIEAKRLARNREIESRRVETGNTRQHVYGQNSDPRTKALTDRGYTQAQAQEILRQEDARKAGKK